MNNQIPEAADAYIWAKEFVKMVKENSAMPTAASYALDEETMIGWFSNAIMSGYDFAQKKSRQEALTPPPSITCPVCGKTSYNLGRHYQQLLWELPRMAERWENYNARYLRCAIAKPMKILFVELSNVLVPKRFSEKIASFGDYYVVGVLNENMESSRIPKASEVILYALPEIQELYFSPDQLGKKCYFSNRERGIVAVDDVWKKFDRLNGTYRSPGTGIIELAIARQSSGYDYAVKIDRSLCILLGNAECEQYANAANIPFILI